MNPEEISVDTSVLVASLVSHDEHHSRAEPLMKRLREGEVIFHCSTFAPVETCGVLRTKEFGKRKVRLPLPAVREAWDKLSQWIQQDRIKVHPLTEQSMKSAATLAIRHRLKGTDAVIIQAALELKQPLETYDGKMAKAWQREQSRA